MRCPHTPTEESADICLSALELGGATGSQDTNGPVRPRVVFEGAGGRGRARDPTAGRRKGAEERQRREQERGGQ